MVISEDSKHSKQHNSSEGEQRLAGNSQASKRPLSAGFRLCRRNSPENRNILESAKSSKQRTPTAEKKGDGEYANNILES